MLDVMMTHEVESIGQKEEIIDIDQNNNNNNNNIISIHSEYQSIFIKELERLLDDAQSAYINSNRHISDFYIYATWMLLCSIEATEQVGYAVQTALWENVDCPPPMPTSCTEGHALREIYARSSPLRFILATLRWLKWFNRHHPHIYFNDGAFKCEAGQELYHRTAQAVNDNEISSSQAFCHLDWPLTDRRNVHTQDKDEERELFRWIVESLKSGDINSVVDVCNATGQHWINSIIQGERPYSHPLLDPMYNSDTATRRLLQCGRFFSTPTDANTCNDDELLELILPSSLRGLCDWVEFPVYQQHSTHTHTHTHTHRCTTKWI
eukprot:GHVR01133067.1.p1 GENE.GHVR01133067.1~~GHVR01133067.1.p1  ORF type:complete len:323 (+),score=96.18 GHVR01133067.1:102-1070(+)